MKRSEAIREIGSRADKIRAMGAAGLFLFGSAARDEARLSSDIDAFVDYDRSTKFSAFDLIGIKLYLEDELKVSVDLTTRDGLHPALRDRILDSSVRIF